MTQAQKQEIENRAQWTQTYFDMRAVNRAARAAERGPRPTMEQLARIAHEGIPAPLSPSQVDPVSGKSAGRHCCNPSPTPPNARSWTNS